MSRFCTLFVFSIFSLLALLLATASYAAPPVEWKFTLTKTGGNYTLTPPSDGFSTDQPNAITDQVTISITCTGASCTDVELYLTAAGALPLSPVAAATSSTVSYVIKREAVPRTTEQFSSILIFKVKNAGGTATEVGKFNVYDGKAPSGEDKNGSGNSGSSGSLIECLRGRTFRGAYDEAANRALFVVTSTGNVLARPIGQIDEDDEIIVKVVGLTSQLEGLQVKQTSAFRDGTALRILGEAPASTSEQKITEQSTDECGEITLSAGNGFDPGKGTIELSQLKGGESVPITSFDFLVNPLYAGAFSFGPAYSKLGNYTYGYVATGADTTLTVTDRESPRIHYVLAYTPFIWGNRDVAKLKSLRFYEHFNPTIALTVRNTFDNAFIGISGDLFRNSAFFTVGQHIGKVSRLDPNAGLNVGDKLTPGKRTIPTVRSWENDWFFSVTIDLRAALRFFNAGLASAPR
ncbi:hypothetical protein [Hymenobacter metallicola]|uniref:Uncharacterized protein n=1 Tax=Hymenobacter metallicola TaxID=2563114 RepID=A0A4Z0QCL3_9BACT|nr:hypothetical protein [Hymenobacter metallicola]TGE26452.1 hypothetical protein E5K02_16800 [Hymenobacter metallicola]